MHTQNVKEPKKKQGKEIILVSFVILLVLTYFYAIWEIYLDEFIYHERFHYISYDSFLRNAEVYDFAPKLPDSARQKRYYSKVYAFVSVCGYRITLDDTDYEQMKLDGLKRFYDKTPPSIVLPNDTYYVLDEANDAPISFSQLEQEGIDFLDQLIEDPKNSTDYYVLYYYSCYSEWHFSYGMICNDETNEIIEFSYTDKAYGERTYYENNHVEYDPSTHFMTETHEFE